MSAQKTKSQSPKGKRGKGKPQGLNPKQLRFVKEYLVDRNGAQAAIRAGYSKHTARTIANELLTKPDIRAAVDKGEEEITKSTELSRDYVINGLMANAERAMQYREVLDKDGKPTGEFRYEGQVANKSYELLGKAIGIFVDRQKIEYDEATLSALLNSMPPELADAMRRELALALSRKRG